MNHAIRLVEIIAKVAMQLTILTVKLIESALRALVALARKR